MKSKLFEKLKTEGSSFGLSDEAIGGVVELLSANLTSESSDEDLTKVSELGLGVMRTIQSTTQKEVSRIAKPKNEPKKVDPTKVDVVDKVEDDKTPEWAKALLEKSQALEEQVKAMQGVNVRKSREQQLREVYKGISKETIDKLITPVEHIEFNDEGFDAYLETQKLIAENIRAKEGADKVNSIGQTRFSVAKDKLPSEEDAKQAFQGIGKL